VRKLSSALAKVPVGGSPVLQPVFSKADKMIKEVRKPAQIGVVCRGMAPGFALKILLMTFSPLKFHQQCCVWTLDKEYNKRPCP
jgi:hypothetical protein